MTDFASMIVSMIARNGVVLPPFPEVAMRLQQLLASEQYDGASLAKIVGTDPALTVAVLRTANSASLRGLDPTAAVGVAIGRLGTEQLRQIVLASSVGELADAAGALVDLRRLVWSRALTSAIFCRVIALRRHMPADDLFTCGLLHDFGWLVGLISVERLLAKLPHEPPRSAAEWMALIDEFHIELGMMVARKWKLSPLLCAVIELHHQPHQPQMNTSDRAAVDLVAASDAVVALLETRPSVSVADLAGIPHLGSAADIDYIAEFLPEIPPLVVSLLDISPHGTARQVASKVSKPIVTLHGAAKPRLFPGTWFRGADAIPVKVLAISPDGFLLEANVQPRDNFLMRFKLDLPEGSMDLCGNSVHSSTQGKQYLVEVRIFGVGGRVKEAWNRLYAEA